MVTLPEPVKEIKLMFNENIQDEMYHEVSLFLFLCCFACGDELNANKLMKALCAHHCG